MKVVCYASQPSCWYEVIPVGEDSRDNDSHTFEFRSSLIADPMQPGERSDDPEYSF